MRETGGGFDPAIVGKACASSACPACWCRSASAAPGSAFWMPQWPPRLWAVRQRSHPFAGSVVMATLALVHGAPEELQDDWLPRIAAGEVRVRCRL